MRSHTKWPEASQTVFAEDSPQRPLGIRTRCRSPKSAPAHCVVGMRSLRSLRSLVFANAPRNRKSVVSTRRCTYLASRGKQTRVVIRKVSVVSNVYRKTCPRMSVFCAGLKWGAGAALRCCLCTTLSEHPQTHSVKRVAGAAPTGRERRKSPS